MSVLKRRDGGWRIDIVIRRGKNTVRIKKAARGARNRSEALAMERELRAKLERKADPTAKAPSFEAFASDFLERYALANNKLSEFRSKKQILHEHLVPWFGEQQLDSITVEDVETYKAKKLELGLSKKTINNHMAVLSKLFAVAVEWHRIGSAPRIKRMKLPPLEHDFFPAAESRRLIEAGESFSCMIAVAIHTGLRMGELLGLRRSDVSQTKIVVRQAIVCGEITTPKSHKAREIPLNRTAREALAHAGAFTGARDGYVFHGEGGVALTRGECKWPLWSACRRAGLRRVGWHLLRHSFASQLATAGVSMRSIQDLLGHSDIRQTMRYAYLSPQVTEDAVRALDEDGAITYGTGSQGPTTDRKPGEEA